MSIRLIGGDCREVLATLPANSVHCVVTSPPYYGLRDYGTAQWAGGDAACDHKSQRTASAGMAAEMRDRGNERGYVPSSNFANYGERWTDGSVYRDTCGKCGATRVDRQIGLEASPAEYLAEMVAVFREVKRVLRPDGTCWVNMGDSYASAPVGSFNGGGFKDKSAQTGGRDMSGVATSGVMNKVKASGLKPKDLLMMPARLALALQADGWWLRSDIIWHKPNPMPESVGDRPTSAHEHVFLLAKSARYFYDADAVREVSISDHPSGNGYKRDARLSYTDKNGARGNDEHWQMQTNRNLRNVWTIATAPYSEAHFATFPPALAERCVRAGTSERGCCAACGAPWGRQLSDKTLTPAHGGARRKTTDAEWKDGWEGIPRMTVSTTTTGWAASCACDAGIVPCTVLDPFAGAGTSLLVSDRLQRDAIGIELNPAYTEMAMARCRDDAPLFAEPSPPPAEPEERIRDLFA
jgi:DNA modification methylase